MTPPPPDRAAFYQYVGQLYVESRHQLEAYAVRVAELEAALSRATQDRDAALALVSKGGA